MKLAVRVPLDGDWSHSPDFQQVMRYARELDAPAILVDSNRIFLIERGGTAPIRMIERHNATPADLNTIGRHLTDGQAVVSRAEPPRGG